MAVRRRTIALAASVLAAATTLTGIGAVEAQAAGPTATDEVLTSFDGTKIAITVFRPAGASARNRVPVVLDSHGWAGSRRTSLDDPVVSKVLARGYGLVSIDQRGHGDSGGQANVQDPAFEGRDNMKVVDRVARLGWARMESPGDPVLGAIGYSYGGGYQLMTALLEQRTRKGGTRFDALSPQITWHDLPESLAPSDVPRTAWLAALYAARGDRVPPYIHRAFLETTVTGQVPASLKTEFAQHSPRWYTDRGLRLDVPMLMRQGSSDNLFNLNQGLANLAEVMTPAALRRSTFVSYDGGHALPNAFPPGELGTNLPPDGVDACSGTDFLDRTLDFFDEVLAGKRPTLRRALPTRFNLTVAGGKRCLHLAALPTPKTTKAGTVVTPAGAGTPQYVPLLTGPATVAGIPRLRARLTTLGLDGRAFLGLAVGSSPADARVVQNNVMPLRRAGTVDGESVALDLPGVTVDVGPGQQLFLMVSPVSDIFVLSQSRVPGALVLDGIEVDLPTV